MSTGYSWEGIRQVRATLLGARRHVPERLCGGCLLGALYQVFDLYLFTSTDNNNRCLTARESIRANSSTGLVLRVFYRAIYLQVQYTQFTSYDDRYHQHIPVDLLLWPLQSGQFKILVGAYI